MRRSPTPTLAGMAFLWAVLSAICFGLGYPTLNRYDWRTQNVDVVVYYDMVEGEPQPGASLLAGRALVPWIARGVYSLSHGNIGTWDPVYFALLVTNSWIMAASACLLVLVAAREVDDHAVSLLAALLYLLNFQVANRALSALVDSGEALFLMILAWALKSDRWWLLPFVGVVGAITKESIVPIAGAFAFCWWLAGGRPQPRRWWRFAHVFALGALGVTVVTAFNSYRLGSMLWPWTFTLSLRGEGTFAQGLTGVVTDHTFVYVFGWLAPVGLLCAARLSRTWRAGAAGGFVMAWLLGAWDNALGNTVPSLFHAAGPLLSTSAALLLLHGRASEPAAA